jgi:hypothetical protein
MVTGTYNISLLRGDDFDLGLTVKKNGSVLELSGYTATVHLYLTDRETPLLSPTPVLGSGTISFSIAKADIDALTFQVAYWELVLRDAGAVPVFRLHGTAEMRKV